MITDEASWHIGIKEIERPVKLAGSSAPGPDGIPYAAWKLSGNQALQVLLDAATALQSDDAPTLLHNMHGSDIHAEGHTFNLGLLICLGKKPKEHHPAHGEVFEPSNTRPLSIVNTDNRLIANDASLRWERNLNPWVSPQQQGFLRRRSILKNILDVEFSAMKTALSSTEGAMIFFDFASAFPSMSQQYLIQLLTSLGLPKTALNLIRSLYNNNRCVVQTSGFRGDGFPMTAGVRQGCPLSPLLYAVCADLLIERIRHKLPSAVVRAYADDTAVLIQSLWRDAPILAQIFEEFEKMSNLKLNLSKTVVVPLFPTPSLLEAKASLTSTVPSWSAAKFAYHAKYLGFLLGPTAQDKSWQDATLKFQRRAHTWSDQQIGLHCTVIAYNVFALSVLTYIAQLTPPTQEVLEAEQQALRKLAPGPTAWIDRSHLLD